MTGLGITLQPTLGHVYCVQRNQLILTLGTLKQSSFSCIEQQSEPIVTATFFNNNQIEFSTEIKILWLSLTEPLSRNCYVNNVQEKQNSIRGLMNRHRCTVVLSRER